MQITIPTKDEIRTVIDEALNDFFSKYQFKPQIESEELGGIDLAIEITGLAKPTIYGLVSERKIPHSKRGKMLYFSRNELTEWLKQGKRKTNAEIAIEAENFGQKAKAVSADQDKKPLSKRLKTFTKRYE